jgi:hypothetical protein
MEAMKNPGVVKQIVGTTVLLRIFGFMPNFKQQITLKTLENVSVLVCSSLL